jgi:hypothetical protein
MGGAINTNAMLALQGQNMAQSGQAYARAQQQMQALRDQGLEVGRSESASQYNRGQAAKDRYAGSVANFAGADSDFQRQMAGYRGERAGYGDRGFEIGRQKAGEDYSMGLGQSELEHSLGTKAASQDYDLDSGLTQSKYDVGSSANKEDFGLSTGLAGMKHQLASDDAARRLAAINAKSGVASQIAGNNANVGYQQQIMGPQILGGLGGAGVRAAAASGGGGGGGGTGLTSPEANAAAAAPAPAAGNYAPSVKPTTPQMKKGVDDEEASFWPWGKFS